MKRTIEIDDDAIADGYEPVAFRLPLDSDQFVVSTGGVVIERGGAVPDGPRLIVRRTTSEVTLACVNSSVLVSNTLEGPYVERMLVDISVRDRDYPYICEPISHKAPNQCWRYAKRLEIQVKQDA